MSFRKKIILFLLFCLSLFLRLYHFNFSPPSPYWEEVALAYDSYSIAQTGKDHHGNYMPLTAFESFGDYKPSLYFYVTVPFIKLFGLSVTAVRLPTVFSSIAVVFGTAFLVKILFEHFYARDRRRDYQRIFLLAAFLAVASPWLLTFSRSAWESVLAGALILWGFNFWLLFVLNNKAKHAVLATALLALSAYAYHAARITAPLLGLASVIFYFVYQKKARRKINYKALLISGVLALAIFLPIAKTLFGSGQQRIAETSIFSDLSIIEKSNQLRAEHGNTLWSRLIYHRYLLFGKEIAINFFSHFSLTYLFVSGDNNPRHSVQTFGEFYYLDMLFFIFALFFFIERRNKVTWLLLFYMVAAIFPASVTKATPHALRTFAALPVFLTCIVFGFWQFLNSLSHIGLKKMTLSVLVFLYGVLLSSFFVVLVFVYPNQYKSEWQYGYQEMNQKLAAVENDYQKIYITREQGRPAMYYFFYQKVDPREVQAFDSMAKKDQGEFLNFRNIDFIDKADQVDLTSSEKTLLISSMNFYQNNFADKGFKIINQTEDNIWVFYEQEK